MADLSKMHSGGTSIWPASAWQEAQRPRLSGGGGIAGAGANGLLQGYVQSTHTFLDPTQIGGGLTFGSRSPLRRTPKPPPVSLGQPWGAHELGHTLQFIGLQAIGNPWVAGGVYAGLGIAARSAKPAVRFGCSTNRQACSEVGGGRSHRAVVATVNDHPGGGCGSLPLLRRGRAVLEDILPKCVG